MNSKVLYFIFFALLFTIGADAQEEIDTTLTPKKPVIFRDKNEKSLRIRKLAGEYRLRSNGWSIGATYVISDKKNNTKNKESFTEYHIGFGYTRTPEESKSLTIDEKFVKYGKINALYPLELTIGKRHKIGRKAVHKGVQIFYQYRGGIILGLMAPYSIETVYGTMDKYTDNNKFAYEQLDGIRSSKGSFKNIGLNNLVPGFIVEGNFIFDYQIRKNLTISPIVGMSFAYYTSSIPLMFTGNSGPLFAEVHLGVEIGRYKLK